MIEQWGYSSTNGVTNVTFRVVYGNFPSVSVCGNYNDGAQILWRCLGYNISTTGFSFSITITTKKTWYSKGY